MTDKGHGLQILSVTKSHSFMLEERELEQLLLREDVRDLPVVLVSVAGAYRGGKSFLLNFFLRYLSAPGAARNDGSWLGKDSDTLHGFKWRSGSKRTTMGILMWSEPFIMRLASGEKVAVLLVDTQGTFDSRSSVRENSTVFALSTLISSIQIYNLSQNIQEDDLQHLELFTEYGKLVNANLNGKAFQVLEFLVRDWSWTDDYAYGAVGGEQLLAEKLEITDDLPKEMKELRQHIRSSFDTVSCFLMPHPGLNVTRRTFKGNISDINPEFRTQLIVLVDSLFGPEKLLPKTLNGERVKARDLFNYFKTYVELFNSDDIPSPTNIMAATVKGGLLSAVSEARDVYEMGMDSECGPEQPNVPAVDLKFLHDKYVALARDAYSNKKKMGSAEEIAEYLEKLTKGLEDRLAQFRQSNEAKVLSARSKAKDAYEKIIENANKDGQLCVHAKDVEVIHKVGVDAALKIYDASRKRVTDEIENERDAFIQEFSKDYDYLSSVNIRNNTILVSNLEKAYDQTMLAKAGLKPLLSEAKFQAEHNIALTKALEDFNAKRNTRNHYTEDEDKKKLTEDIVESYKKLEKLYKSINATALEAAILKYISYMGKYWDDGTKCVHPRDLDEKHEEGKCQALTDFRPERKCSDGFDATDNDENHLNEVITEKYGRFLKDNDTANKAAVSKAYKKYVNAVTEADALIKGAAIAGLAIINPITLFASLPVAVATAPPKIVIQNCITQALRVFYEQRRSSINSNFEDIYKHRLIEMINKYNCGKCNTNMNTHL